MAVKDFYLEISTQFNKELPFVAYRKPDESKIQAFLQKDDVLYKTFDYSESGFVFAPFDIRKSSILIPFSKSRKVTTYEVPFVNTSAESVLDSESQEETHVNLVSKGIKAIHDGSYEKIVLSRSETINLRDFDLIKVFSSLLKLYDNALVYCWYHPKVGLWLGATPETLLSTNGTRFSTMALAGTQVYNGTTDVKWNDKEIEEQQIVTDYLSEALKDISEMVSFSEVKTTRAGNLLHLKTDVSGLLTQKEKGLQKLILALHPTPAVCGLPKLDAMQFILDNEQYNREFYTGFLGELNLEAKIQPRSGARNIENRAYAFNSRNTHLFVNLRCMQVQEKKALVYVGGGITKDSVPEHEYQETINKTRTMKNVLN